MKISVVVSTFNRRVLLEELLSSLEAQTLSADRFEVIVVDDGSSEPVEPGLRQRPRPFHFDVITQSNAGVAAARHAGVLRATGEIIVVLDDDMLAPETFLAAHLRAHEAGYTLVLGHIAAAPATATQKRPLFERMHTRQLDKFIARYRGLPTAVRGVMVCTGNVSFRRADYLAVGGFDRSLGRSEDRELGVRLEKAGARLTFAYDARTINRSDHTDFEVWMQRNFLYGVFDARISKKHPDVAIADPWHFLFIVNPVSRGLLMGAVAAPGLAKHVSRLAYRSAELLDARGWTGPALAGATLCYGLEYFRGVRGEAGSLRESVRGLRRHMKERSRDGRA
jgi:glycosyltransferase involved in cell wall biosynthesis